MNKVFEYAKVIDQFQLSDGIFDLRLRTKAAQSAVPGQFINVYPHDESKRLPRPISICGIDKENSILRLVYRVTKKGSGTDEFSHYKTGEEVKILGPLGNGFPVEEFRDKNVFLMGGGIGIPPMLSIASALKGKCTAVLGYRDKNTFLVDDFIDTGCKLVLTSDDGSVGMKGNVIDAATEAGLHGDVIFACGPTPMLRGIKTFSEGRKITCYVSLEERMACGVGACLGCVCKSSEEDEHSKVHNKRVCKDGPVFLAQEVEI
jgi:dihydroorotate dehydrogenase electron transfer subunit